MTDFVNLRFLRRLSLRAVLFTLCCGLALACSTSHESDTGANQDYGDEEGTGARPSLPTAVTPAATEPKAAKPVPARPRSRAVVVKKATPNTNARTAPRPVVKAGPSTKEIERLAAQPRKLPNYSPMVDRTASGVRVVKDFSSQANSKAQRDNAAAVKAYRTQQNAKMARAYNNNNLLTR